MPRFPRSMQEFVHPGAVHDTPEFPDAPEEWSPQAAQDMAAKMGIELSDDHWEAIRVVQGAYRDEPQPPLRRIHDALDGRFADRGGIRHLYAIFGGGPVYRACVLAGVRPPAGAVDEGFGSVA